MSRYTIPAAAVRRQLLDDLIGKDSYRGVTLTYSWLANQFGHFSLAFIPTFLLFQLLQNWWTKSSAAFWSAVIISLAWVVFETFNFLWPLLRRKDKTKEANTNSKYTFQPDWKNVAFDTGTDLLFFSLGAFAASILLSWSVTTLIILLVVVALLIYPSHYWYVTKMYLQIAQYPFQFRLSQYDLPLNADQKDLVQQFLQSTEKGKHLLLFGAKGSGKTSLGVGIATELSIQHHPCVYTTGIKLYTSFFDLPSITESEKLRRPLWDWRCCATIVIDDINPGEPIKDDIVSPDFFFKYLTNYNGTHVNLDTIKSCNVIWVLGTEVEPEKAKDKWKQMLTSQIGIDAKSIITVHLT